MTTCQTKIKPAKTQRRPTLYPAIDRIEVFDLLSSSGYFNDYSSTITMNCHEHTLYNRRRRQR